MRLIFILPLAVTLLTAFSTRAEALEGCFTHVYSADHMSQHPGQYFDWMRVQLDTFTEDGGFTNARVTAMLPGNDNVYTFEAQRPAKAGNSLFLDHGKPIPDDVYCAPSMGDGQEYDGCIQLKKDVSGDLTLKPVRLTYYSMLGDEKIKKAAGPTTLIFCKDNASTDGEGCPADKSVKAELLPNDFETGTWKLSSIPCDVKVEHPKSIGAAEGTGGAIGDSQDQDGVAVAAK